MVNLFPRRTFITGDRQPVVIFFTSSAAKFSQAKALFDGAGLQLAYRVHDTKPYHEDYAGTKEELLSQAIGALQDRGGASGSLFFIEDTSIRIEALSTDEDFPGLSAKEWFAATSFEELTLKVTAAHDQRATVKSCIALSVPGLSSPIFFYGETQGHVADQPANFEASPFYPWLSPDNFSAWFIPDGATLTLSEMSFEESLFFDFRAKAMQSLLDRLAEYSIILNASPPMFSRRHVAKDAQPTLFQIEQPVLLVVGPTCSGKTTFGTYVQQNLGWRFVDASSIVRIMREDRQESATDVSDFAHQLLDAEGPDVVARFISEKYLRGASDEGIVITGFRTIEEVEFFRQEHAGVQVIALEAPPRLRYERYLRRGTRTSINSFEEFARIDERQHTLGLLRIAGEIADMVVENVHSERDYVDQIAKVLGRGGNNAKGVTRVAARLNPEKSQLYRCLEILRSAGRPLTTQEIEARFPKGDIIRYNNANKMLKRYPELAFRRDSPQSNVKYQITSNGLAFLSAVERLNRLAD